jgi:hypothetical protein
MVCLKGELGLTPDRIIKAWAKFFPALPPISHTPSKAAASPTPRGDSAVIELSLSPSRTVMVAVMPMPVPGNDIPASCEASWMWPDAAQQLAAHKAHAIILTPPSTTAIADALDISRIATCVAAAGEGLGIYWGNGGHVHKPKTFLDFLSASAESDIPPVMLWIGLRISGDSAQGPFILTSRGLASFGHRELEIIDTRMPIGDLREFAYNTISYLLANGPILKHNQTFGRTPEEKFRIEHTTSQFREGEPVLKLHVP